MGPSRTLALAASWSRSASMARSTAQPGGEPAQVEAAAGSQLGGAGLVVEPQTVAAGGLAGRHQGPRRRQRALPELVEHAAQRTVGALRPTAEIERPAQHRQRSRLDRHRIPAGGGVQTQAHRHDVGLGGGELGHRGAQRGLGVGGTEIAHLDARRLAERLAAGPPTGRRRRRQDSRRCQPRNRRRQPGNRRRQQQGHRRRHHSRRGRQGRRQQPRGAHRISSGLFVAQPQAGEATLSDLEQVGIGPRRELEEGVGCCSSSIRTAPCFTSRWASRLEPASSSGPAP